MIITQTPLRISLAGGGTDFPHFYESDLGPGAVVSTAIDKYVYVIVKKRCDDLIVLNYSKREETHRVDDLQHELVREAMKKVGVESGIEIHTLADIRSEGSGLGSSGSFTVGILNALYAYVGEQVPASMLAEQACEIEIDLLGKPIGKQDQYIAAYGGICMFSFGYAGVAVRRLPISEWKRRHLDARLMLFYLGKPRATNGLLAEQKERTKRNLKALQGLARAANSMEESIMGTIEDDLPYRFDTVGHILRETWEIKRTLVGGISTAEINTIYEMALEAGALGGKVCGAGGGGHMVLYVPMDCQGPVAIALRAKGVHEVPFHLSRFGSQVIFNVGD